MNAGTWIPVLPVLLLRLQFYIGFEEAFACKFEVEKEIGIHVLAVKRGVKWKLQDFLKDAYIEILPSV